MAMSNDKYYRLCIKDTGEYYNCLTNDFAHKYGILVSSKYTKCNYCIEVVEPINPNASYEELKYNRHKQYDIKLGQPPYNKIIQAQKLK